MLTGWRGFVLTAWVATLFWWAVGFAPGEDSDSASHIQAYAFFADITSANGLLALFTAVLAGVGIVTYLTFNKQADIMAGTLNQMAQDAQLARAEFVATHRPKIIIRNVTTTGVVVGFPIEGRFIVINVGDTPATLDVVEAIVILLPKGNKLPRNMNLTPCRNVSRRKIVSGDFIVPSQASTFEPSPDHICSLQKGERLLCIVGSVQYSDDNGVKRRTGFARCCDISEIQRGGPPSFDPIPDEEYEFGY